MGVRMCYQHMSKCLVHFYISDLSNIHSPLNQELFSSNSIGRGEAGGCLRSCYTAVKRLHFRDPTNEL